MNPSTRHTAYRLAYYRAMVSEDPQAMLELAYAFQRQGYPLVAGSLRREAKRHPWIGAETGVGIGPSTAAAPFNESVNLGTVAGAACLTAVVWKFGLLPVLGVGAALAVPLYLAHISK